MADIDLEFATAVGALIKSGRWTGRTLAANTDLDDVTTEGFAHAESYAIASTITSKPSWANGNPFTVESWIGSSHESPVLYQRFTQGDSLGLREGLRHRNAGIWYAWKEYFPELPDEAEAWPKGRITGPVDAFTLPPGIYTVTTPYDAQVENLPEHRPGTLTVTGNPGQLLRTIEFAPHARAYVWRTTNQDTAGAYIPWWKVEAQTGTPGDAGETVEPQHHIRKTMFIQAMGGPIDTGGRAAIAFRADHGFANFASKVLPVLRARGIVPSMVYNPRRWASTENQGITATDLNAWVAAGEVEVWNHGATHGDVSTEADLYDQIVNSLAEIEAELPAAAGKVWGFAPPGVDPATGYGGFGNGATPEKWDTVAGRLILKHHAVAAAYIPSSSLRVLDGDPRSGLGHMTMETSTVASLKSWIDVAITRRQGLQLMIHSSLLDTPGYMTTAQFTEVVDYAVAKRTAGQLVTLSPYQMLVADSTKPRPYDSGWRDITGLLEVQPSAGKFLIRRQGDTVHVQTAVLAFDTTYPTFVTLGQFFPTGFRPNWDLEFQPAKRHDIDTPGALRIDRSGRVILYDVRANQLIRTYATFFTTDTPPATPPGIPG